MSVAYINCSAGVKALSDVICTSGNAKKIVERVPKGKEILFVPDQNLGQWVSQQTGREMQLWPGSCYAHVLFTFQALKKIKDQFPEALIVATPGMRQNGTEILPMKSAQPRRWFIFVRRVLLILLSS